MDAFLDAITSLFSGGTRRHRTPQEESARAVAYYCVPVLAAFGVVSGAEGIVAVGVLPVLAIGLTVAIVPSFGLDAARSLRLGIRSGLVCFVVNGLMLLLSQPLF